MARTRVIHFESSSLANKIRSLSSPLSRKVYKLNIKTRVLFSACSDNFSGDPVSTGRGTAEARGSASSKLLKTSDGNKAAVRTFREGALDQPMVVGGREWIFRFGAAEFIIWNKIVAALRRPPEATGGAKAQRSEARKIRQAPRLRRMAFHKIVNRQPRRISLTVLRVDRPRELLRVLTREHRHDA